MEDYEINILRRDGNWKKVKPNDLIIDEIDNDFIEDNEPDKKKLQNDDQVDAWIRDQYLHPLETTHTFDEILKWFDKNNIEFINSIPELDFVKFYQKL